MSPLLPLKKILLSATLFCSTVFVTYGQDVSQIAFTDLQTQANKLADQGRLIEAIPFLKELVKRVEDAENSEIQLDYPIFLIGTGYIQSFVESQSPADIQEAIRWYEKLEKEHPESPKLKEALLKKVDLYRASNQSNLALQLMQKIIAGEYNFRLSYSEEIGVLKDLTQIYYSSGRLSEGLPYFGRLYSETRDQEDRSLAAAASFEALIEKDRTDDALKLLPDLAQESTVRYQPRLNVALLKASDKLVNEVRLNDASILLNLIKTTDVMIAYYEAQLVSKKQTLDQRMAFDSSSKAVKRIEQEIKNIEANLSSLRSLPSLRNDLLVRRARNYTKTGRRYEAFWMFYDLMKENPDHKEIEFYAYAAFSNALRIGKKDTVADIGRDYRQRFPDGDYYSDVSLALAVVLKEENKEQEFLDLTTDFITKRPQDPTSNDMFDQWADYLFGKARYQDVISQIITWVNLDLDPVYQDSLYYWGAMAQLQFANFTEAARTFNEVVENFPKSRYYEDSVLRKGSSLFYCQRFGEARESLNRYLKEFPNGSSLDVAYFFLGEVENLAGNYDLALSFYEKSTAVTRSQDIIDSNAFKIGAIYAATERYDRMEEHFTAYIQKYGEFGRLTDAVFELGKALELQQKPNAMLELYRDYIERYAVVADNTGIDTLIEGYAEKYYENKERLLATVGLVNQLEKDASFREQFVTDRGFLFEHFYNNPSIDQTLYNQLRQHPDFGPQLVKDLSPISDLLAPFKSQLAEFPQSTPQDFFRKLLQMYQKENESSGEIRMLMGLYRIGETLEPTRSFSEDDFKGATPRVLLFIADYSRKNNLDFAVKTWNEVLRAYPLDDTAIVSYMRLADVDQERGNYEAALNHLDTLVERFPGSPMLPAVILRQGELLTKLERGEEAREKYQYILRVPSWRGVHHAKAIIQTGDTYMAENAFAQAHGFYERAYLAYPQFPEWSARAYLSDAEALIKMNAQQDAISVLEEARELATRDTPEELLQQINTKLKELQS